MRTLARPARGMCVYCGRRCRSEPVLSALLEHFMGIAWWFTYRLLLCPPCRQAFVDAHHVGECLNPLELDGQPQRPGRWRGGVPGRPGGLPDEAPLADAPIRLTASWPRSSRPSAIDERRSRLWK